jgi:PIN domain nuclease of toxin-antitoxin system
MDDPSKLSPVARAEIANPANAVLASAVSIWELGLKVSKGKLRLPLGFHELLEKHGIQPLPFIASHAIESIALPEIHGDPFDRALVAQCRLENLTLATRDRILADYGIPVLAV